MEREEGLYQGVTIDRFTGLLVNNPAEWYVPMHIATKKNGKQHRTVDFQKLNKTCIYQTHPTTAPFPKCHVIPLNTIRKTLDAWNNSHFVPLVKN